MARCPECKAAIEHLEVVETTTTSGEFDGDSFSLGPPETVQSFACPKCSAYVTGSEEEAIEILYDGRG